MRAGTLRDRVTIQTLTRAAADSYGQRAESWTDLATVWAEVRTLSGRESFYAQQTHPEATVMVRIRYRSDVTSACRFVFGSRTFNPLSVVPDQKREEMLCTCTEVIA